jgi:hypothetical protein
MLMLSADIVVGTLGGILDLRQYQWSVDEPMVVVKFSVRKI